MKKSYRSLLASAAIGILAAPAAAFAQQQPSSPERSDQQRMGASDDTSKTGEPIPLAQVPEPARKAIESRTKGGKVEKVEKITAADGTTQYRAHIEREGQKRELLVAADGKVLETRD